MRKEQKLAQCSYQTIWNDSRFKTGGRRMWLANGMERKSSRPIADADLRNPTANRREQMNVYTLCRRKNITWKLSSFCGEKKQLWRILNVIFFLHDSVSTLWLCYYSLRTECVCCPPRRATQSTTQIWILFMKTIFNNTHKKRETKISNVIKKLFRTL